MTVKTFEQTLESVKAGAAKPNSDEVDAAVLKRAQEEYAAEHPEEGTKLTSEPEKAHEPSPEPEVKPELEVKEPVKDPEEKEPEAKLTDDEVLSKQEDTLSDADKLRRFDLLKVKDEAEKKEIALYAQAEGMTEEEAKKAIEAEKKIAEQYQNDPRKLSRTARYWQSQHAKLESKIKAESEAKQRIVGENEVLIQGKKMTFDEAKPLMIEAYRTEFADKVANLTDEEVFETAKKDYQAKVKAHFDIVGKRIAEDARTKRARMILELPDQAKPFREEIESSLNLLPDARVIQDDYSLDDIVAWARGRYYSPEKLKELEDSAFKRGQENAKILGEKVHSTPSSPKQSKEKAINPDKELASLTREQKDQALNMFDGISHWNEERKFKEYIEVMKDTGRWTTKKETVNA